MERIEGAAVGRCTASPYLQPFTLHYRQPLTSVHVSTPAPSGSGPPAPAPRLLRLRQHGQSVCDASGPAASCPPILSLPPPPINPLKAPGIQSERGLCALAFPVAGALWALGKTYGGSAGLEGAEWCPEVVGLHEDTRQCDHPPLQLFAEEPGAGEAVPARSGVGLTGSSQTMFYAEVTEAQRGGPGGGLAEEGELIEVVHLPLADAQAFSDNPDVPKTLGVIFGISWFFSCVAPGLAPQ
ncbi:uridine diphosphate glucose pyrophosphatase NUDT14 isoform 1-T1 [Glossophaga mutica]